SAAEELEKRVVAYLKACDAAVSGQRGHSTTFRVAAALCRGFLLPVDDAVGLLLEHYNPRCVPPWTEVELRHKCEDAKKATNGQKADGWLLNAGVTGETAKGKAGKPPPPDQKIAGSPAPAAELVIESMADVRMEPITWLVEGYIPEGKVVNV